MAATDGTITSMCDHLQPLFPQQVYTYCPVLKIDFTPLHQQQGVVHTLFDRAYALVREEEDRRAEIGNVKAALRLCNYPDWVFQKFESQMAQKTIKAKKKDSIKKETSTFKNLYEEAVLICSQDIRHIMSQCASNQHANLDLRSSSSTS